MYEQHAELERDHWWFVARRAIIAEVLSRHLGGPGPRRILDVGCGTGGMLPMLSRFGEVSGLDPEPFAVAHCRASFPSFDVELGRVPVDLPGDGAFDVVTAFDVIEHLDDSAAALASIQSTVRPGGSVVLTVPALSWLWSDHDVANGHRRRYGRQQLLAEMNEVGLEIVHVSYFNTVLLPVVAAARGAQRLRPRTVQPHSDFSMPSRPINTLLRCTMAAERSIVAGRGLPVGVSLIAVVRVPAGSGANAAARSTLATPGQPRAETS